MIQVSLNQDDDHLKVGGRTKSVSLGHDVIGRFENTINVN